MEGTVIRSGSAGSEEDGTEVESFQFGEEIQGLMSVPPESGSSFTALLGLPATQAMELLHSPESDEAPATLSGEARVDQCQKPYLPSFNCSPSFPSNAALVERAARFSIFAGGSGEDSPDTNSMPSNSSRVKNEPMDTDSNPTTPPPLISDPTVGNRNLKSAKRKEREKKVKGPSKKNKNVASESSEDAEKLPYVHVRARRGQATDSHSLAERARREKINARMKLLQELVPGCSRDLLDLKMPFLLAKLMNPTQSVPILFQSEELIHDSITESSQEPLCFIHLFGLKEISGTALVLDEIINHVQSLQRQVEFLSMRLAAVNPRIDFNLDSLLAAESGSLMDSSMFTPLMWPEVQVNGNRQQYQQQWQYDAYNQPVWGREEDNHNFITPENSLLSYDSSANSGTSSLRVNLLKMEL